MEWKGRKGREGKGREGKGRKVSSSDVQSMGGGQDATAAGVSGICAMEILSCIIVWFVHNRSIPQTTDSGEWQQSMVLVSYFK